MKRQGIVGLALVSVVLWLATNDTALGRGGRGGGGMRGGGGGVGVSRGGGGFGGGGVSPNGNRTPSFSQPAARPSHGGGARPNTTPSRPATPSTRPSTGTRPGTGLQPGIGSRPSTGTRPGASTLPGNRPEIGTRPATGTRPGVSTRPATGAGIAAGAGAGAAAGVGSRPTTLPGLGGDRVAGRDTRPQTPQDRRDNLQSRMQAGRTPGENRPADRQEHAGQRREDWQNWSDQHYGHHDDWHHGYWHGHWDSGWWDHMWDEHPAAMALGLTTWGVNRLSYTWGYWGYTNPYWVAPVAGVPVYDYSQPLIASETAAAEAPPAQPGAAQLPPGVTPEGLTTFDEARVAFLDDKYADSLKLTDAVLKEIPKDALVHEFRSLVLFALGRYTESAAAIHAVLAVGPGWDWTTLASMYSGIDVYTEQLRALEMHRKEHPDAADARFLLGYHYLTAGHSDAAAREWKRVVELQPKDPVAAQLLQLISPDENPQPRKPASTAKEILPEKLVGTWTASGADKSKFTMTLTKDGNFTWSYTRGATKQEVQGVYAVDQSSLALEMDDGSTMLAQVSFEQPNSLLFKMVGGPPDDPGLEFRR